MSMSGKFKDIWLLHQYITIVYRSVHYWLQSGGGFGERVKNVDPSRGEGINSSDPSTYAQDFTTPQVIEHSLKPSHPTNQYHPSPSWLCIVSTFWMVIHCIILHLAPSSISHHQAWRIPTYLITVNIHKELVASTQIRLPLRLIG